MPALSRYVLLGGEEYLRRVVGLLSGTNAGLMHGFHLHALLEIKGSYAHRRRIATHITSATAQAFGLTSQPLAGSNPGGIAV